MAILSDAARKLAETLGTEARNISLVSRPEPSGSRWWLYRRKLPRERECCQRSFPSEFFLVTWPSATPFVRSLSLRQKKGAPSHKDERPCSNEGHAAFDILVTQPLCHGYSGKTLAISQLCFIGSVHCLRRGHLLLKSSASWVQRDSIVFSLSDFLR